MRDERRNDFSYWYPRVRDCGIRTPESKIILVPEEVRVKWGSEQEAVREWVSRTVVPRMDKREWFLKNARFSNKFNFRNCITNPRKVFDDLWEINYMDEVYEVGGTSEVVLREVIPYNPRVTPTIYNGLPLRCEFRVFYDFDKKHMLYSVNYWEFDYVYPNLRNATDRIVFEHEREKLQADFEQNREFVEQIVDVAMRNVDLTGKWSIDILYHERRPKLDKSKGYEDVYIEFDEDESDVEFWLIDMAEAERSAYWRG